MTSAEAEALERGLHMIKNSDLEEIRELGSGTYGSVCHGKWKGSDVAIKRIKPGCFAGRPSEREQLIDVYSFGIVTWELITGEEPYAHMHCASIIGGIVNNSLRRQVPAWCDPEWRSLMLRCWSSEPSERPSFAEICQALRKMFAVLSGK